MFKGQDSCVHLEAVSWTWNGGRWVRCCSSSPLPNFLTLITGNRLVEEILGVAGIISKKITFPRTAFAHCHKWELRLYCMETDNPDLFSTKSFPVPGIFAAEFEGKWLDALRCTYRWVSQAAGLVKKSWVKWFMYRQSIIIVLCALVFVLGEGGGVKVRCKTLNLKFKFERWCFKQSEYSRTVVITFSWMVVKIS